MMLIRVIYECCMLLLAPFMLLFLIVSFKRKKQSIAPLLGKLMLPSMRHQKTQKISKKKLLWVHAVSLGEMKAITPLVRDLLNVMKLDLVLTFGSETAFKESKKTFPNAIAHFYLPLDLYCFQYFCFKKFRPDLLLISEGDLWLNQLLAAKAWEAKIFLLSGKLSEKSMRYYECFPSFTKLLFQPFDKIFVQNRLYERRFLHLPIEKEKLSVGGNLKFAATLTPLSEKELSAFKKRLLLEEGAKVLLFASYHVGEEKVIVDTLLSLKEAFSASKQKHLLQARLQYLLVPRHPERVNHLLKILDEKELQYWRVTASQKPDKAEIIVLDTIGELLSCYQVVYLSVLLGSFIPNIGGHNILEPMALGSPTIFGPYMENQEEMKTLALEQKACVLSTAKELPSVIKNWIEDEKERNEYSKRGKKTVRLCEDIKENYLSEILRDLS